MSLSEQIRTQMKQAMKARDTVTKEVLRVVLGEISTIEARDGSSLDDAAVQKIVRKLLKSNRETLKAIGADDERHGQLSAENVVLDKLLPQTLDQAAIVAALADVVDAIKAAPNDGAATGVAMKTLKKAGAAVEGRTVSAAVRQIRG